MRRPAAGALLLTLGLAAVAAPASSAPRRTAAAAPEPLGTEVTPAGSPVIRRLSDGTVTAYGVIVNRTAVPTRITRDFAVAFVDAQGEEISRVTNGGGRAFAEQTVLAPGQSAVWRASSGGPLPDAVSAHVVVLAAIASDRLPDEAFSVSDVSVVPTGNGSEQIHVRVTSQDPRPQELVTAHLVFEDASGALVGYDQAVVGDGDLAPRASTDLLVAHALLPGEPVADKVVVTVDAQPTDAVATMLDPAVPVSGRLIAGTVIAASPRLVRADGAPLAGKRLSWQERRPGGHVGEVAHGTTGTDGVARLRVRLNAGTIVQVVFSGDDTTFGSSTGDLVLGVRPALTARIPDATSGPLVVRGSLRPARPGVRVQLQRLVGTHWVPVVGGPVTRDGRFRLRGRLPAGLEHVRVWAPAAPLIPVAATAPVAVIVG